MAKFRKNGSTMMQLQKDDNMRPLYKKLSEVIAEVAKANGYTRVLTTNGNQFGYIDENFDITKLVLAKLGIKE
jgi:outer membrane protein